MFKKSLAWILTVALLLTSLSSLVMISSAAGKQFVYVDFKTGEPRFINATAMSIDQVMEKGGATNMAEVSGDDADRFAYRMTYQNQQIGVQVPAGVITDTENVTVEVKYFVPTKEAGTDLRLGMSYKSSVATGDVLTNGNTAKVDGNGQLDYGNTPLHFTNDAVKADSWETWTVKLDKPNYAAGGNLNLVKWGTGNDDGNEKDSYYIQSILIYAGDERPTEDDLYIREDVIGEIDFTGETVDANGIEYTLGANGSIAEYEGKNAVKLIGDGFNLNLKADPSVVAVNSEKDGTDANVTVMVEYYMDYSGDHNNRICLNSTDSGWYYGPTHNGDRIGNYVADKWAILTMNLTENATQNFNLGTWLGENGSTMYVRKVVIARTDILPAGYTADSAFVWYDDEYAPNPLFPRVTSNVYKLTAEAREQAADAPAAVVDVEGTMAMTANSGFLFVTVDDSYNGKTDIGVSVTYMDKGTGSFGLHYNTAVPADAEDPIPYNFKASDTIALTDSGEWKTSTIYLSDADFRNAANGGDFRIIMDTDGEAGDAGLSISAVNVTVGANKSALQAAVDRRINAVKYSEASVAAYNAAVAAGKAVIENANATKAMVDKAIADIEAAFNALEAVDGDKRFTLSEGTVTSMNLQDATNGELVEFDGWYAWKFPVGQSGKWFGIGDEAGILKDSTSVTYEYDIYFETADNNSRLFMGHGTTSGWVGVKEGAPPTGNGFAAGGQWGATPSVGKWGTITLVNDAFDPTSTSQADQGAAGLTTVLGSWMNTATCTTYVRAIRAYDTSDPTKMISLTFNEAVKEMIVTGENDNVKLTEKDGDKAYMIPSGWQKILIDTQSVIDAGVLTLGENNVTVEFEYFLEELNGNGDANNEMFQIAHYNPEGNGQNGDKANECEHQYYPNNGDLKRGEWTKKTVVLDDANFGNGFFGLKYGNGNELYVRGIKIYATETPKNAAVWGVMKLTAPAPDFGYWDYDEDDGYGLTIKFDEGQTETEFGTMVDSQDVSHSAAMIADDWMYVTVDKELVPEDARFVKITFTYMDNNVYEIHYNKSNEGVEVPDSASEEWAAYNEAYNFAKSGQITTDEEGNITEIGNPLGALVGTGMGDWVTESIYLTDAQFRKSANGADFRVDPKGFMVVARIEVEVITEEDVPVLSDLTKLEAALEKVPEDLSVYTEESQMKLAEAVLNAAEAAMTGRVTAEQEDALVKAIEDAIAGLVMGVKLGDVNNDTKIDSSDARMVLQAAVNKITLTDAQAKAADVNADSAIDSSDARVILQVSVGKAEL